MTIAWILLISTTILLTSAKVCSDIPSTVNAEVVSSHVGDQICLDVRGIEYIEGFSYFVSAYDAFDPFTESSAIYDPEVSSIFSTNDLEVYVDSEGCARVDFQRCWDISVIHDRYKDEASYVEEYSACMDYEIDVIVIREGYGSQVAWDTESPLRLFGTVCFYTPPETVKQFLCNWLPSIADNHEIDLEAYCDMHEGDVITMLHVESEDFYVSKFVQDPATGLSQYFFSPFVTSVQEIDSIGHIAGFLDFGLGVNWASGTKTETSYFRSPYEFRKMNGKQVTVSTDLKLYEDDSFQVEKTQFFNHDQPEACLFTVHFNDAQFVLYTKAGDVETVLEEGVQYEIVNPGVLTSPAPFQVKIRFLERVFGLTDDLKTFLCVRFVDSDPGRRENGSDFVVVVTEDDTLGVRAEFKTNFLMKRDEQDVVPDVQPDDDEDEEEQENEDEIVLTKSVIIKVGVVAGGIAGAVIGGGCILCIFFVVLAGYFLMKKKKNADGGKGVERFVEPDEEMKTATESAV